MSSQAIQCGFHEHDEEEYELDDFWMTTIVRWTPSVYVST